jgi:Leucine-rich repeat (LRR) protein
VKSLKALLTDNQINKQEFRINLTRFKVIECFQFNLLFKWSFSAFAHLTELRILEQDICDLDFLQEVPQLEVLFVLHTAIVATSSLSHVAHLLRLFLEGNKIAAFPNIADLVQLESLSLAMNPLSANPCFPTLPALIFLNLTGIRICVIDCSIQNRENLENLKLNGDFINDFQVIDILGSLECLTELTLADPKFGENPICLLSNYNVLLFALLRV